MTHSFDLINSCLQVVGMFDLINLCSDFVFAGCGNVWFDLINSCSDIVFASCEHLDGEIPSIFIISISTIKHIQISQNQKISIKKGKIKTIIKEHDCEGGLHRGWPGK